MDGFNMSFKERFNSSEPITAPACFNGPPWCGECSPIQCLYMMETAFMDEDQLNDYSPTLEA